MIHSGCNGSVTSAPLQRGWAAGRSSQESISDGAKNRFSTRKATDKMQVNMGACDRANHRHQGTGQHAQGRFWGLEKGGEVVEGGDEMRRLLQVQGTETSFRPFNALIAFR